MNNNNNNNDLSGNAQLMKNVKSRTRRHLPDKHLEGRVWISEAEIKTGTESCNNGVKYSVSKNMYTHFGFYQLTYK
jgi:hypothetical protein